MKLPEIVGNTWFNSTPLAKEDLSGKVILIDFWTYSCINCLRTLPYLQEWWRKYKDKNFLLIGVHTPEFDFEKNPENVQQAIKDLGVEWPQVLDNDHVNWNNFANHYWPAKYMADKKGNLVYEHFGEGAYSETEKKIQELLKDGELLPEVETNEHAHGAVCFIPTAETYCGYFRGRIENSGGYYKNKVANYKIPEEIAENSIALSGKFLTTGEYIESEDTRASLFLNFKATEINLVLATPNDIARVEIALNGELLRAEILGANVNELGEVEIKKPEMYNLLKSKDLVAGILKITAKEGRFQAYAFTFSGCSD